MKKLICTVLLATSLTMLTACGQSQKTPTETSSQVKAVNLADIHTAVKEAYGENYIPNMVYDEQMFKDLFGVDKELYDSYIAEGPMMSTHVDTFIAVEAKKGQGEAVEKILKDYQTKLIGDSMQYPMNIAKVQSSQVIRNGDYVFYVMLGAFDEGSENEEAALKAAEAETKIGVDVINGFFAS